MIKVLHVVSNISIRSGIMSVLMSYYRFIDRSNIQFDFVYFDERENTYESEVNKLGGKIYKLSRKSFLGDWCNFCNEKRNDYDILHVHELFLASCFIGTKKKLGVKKIVFHSHATKFSDTIIKSIRNGLLSLPARMYADACVACSTEAGTYAFGRRFTKGGIVLKNAIDTTRFRFDENKRKLLRAEYDIKEQQVVIGHVGHFNRIKNHIHLINTFICVKKKLPDAILFLVGDGETKNKIKEYIEQNNIKDSVFFLGTISNVYDYLNIMDVFVLPSLFEGLGIVAIEAQVNGIPCVCSSVVPTDTNIFCGTNRWVDLEESFDLWASEIIELIDKRHIVNDEIKKAGYDIHFEKENLEKFYESLLK